MLDRSEPTIRLADRLGDAPLQAFDTAWDLSGAPSLSNRCSTWTVTVSSAMNNFLAIARDTEDGDGRNPHLGMMVAYRERMNA